MEKYFVIGLMSGTSLDGVDIAYCQFDFNGRWSYKLIHAETVSYNEEWKKKLGNIHQGSAEEICITDCSYGVFLGEIVRSFCEKHRIKPDFVSSHGHTIYHQPGKGLTKQLGSGAYLSVSAGLTVICDFRSQDVALGGQGAPLVPIGDRELFSDFDFCLNLGGIANISFENNEERVAFDICACNLVLNHYALKLGKPFDQDGLLAKEGNISTQLLEKLNSLSFYSKSFPRSLSREDVERDILPMIDGCQLSIKDILATFCKHISLQISDVINSKKDKKSLLITGGGAFNSFLIQKITENSQVKISIPEKNVIEFKEAVIFAFLGVLRKRGETNCLRSVTGAKEDSSSGAVYII